MKMCVILLIFLTISRVALSVDDNSEVVTLTTLNFTSTVNDYEICFVEFYATWCGHCKAFAPEYELIAQYFKDDSRVLISKIDADAEKETSFIQSFDVAGYPSLKFRKKSFDNNKLISNNEPTSVQWFDYEGERSYQTIIDHINKMLQSDWVPEGDPVIELDDKNFEKSVAEYKLSLVEFYAPWCGHCKALAPHYKAAAKIMAQMPIGEDEGENEGEIYHIVFAKIDATVNKATAKEYNVTGYPTLKIFRHGQVSEYNGPRDNHENIIKYMLNQVGDGSKEFSTIKNMKTLMSPEDITIVGYFESHDEPKFVDYLKACSSLRDEYKFIHTFEKEIFKSMKAQPNSIVLYQPEKLRSKYESLRYIFPEDEDQITTETLTAFIRKWERPLVGQMTRTNRPTLFMTLPLCIVFYNIDWSFDHIQDTQFWRSKVLEVAKDFHPGITFAIAEETEFQDELKKLQLDDSGEEVSAGCYTQSKRYRMEPQEFEVEAYRNFITDFSKDKLEPIIWSQPIPTADSNLLAPVKILVANNIRDFFNDPVNHNRLIFVEFYAPWCGHCKRLEPVYNKLGKFYQTDNRVSIAKFDVTANDLDAGIIQVKGFPTLILFKPPHLNVNQDYVKYEGKRELEDLKNFIEESYGNFTTKPSEKMPPSTEEEKKLTKTEL